ncbi:carboxylesterase/lipase family protein [Kordiimonas pumila]|uniref:carboxylesterase/lipase family protein n=1 Tax=Kordiimonas pumila TaxID=2161677 RepID=UPI001883F725|nr:carboxylesterase family protein [Kordiimonas pumila]
MRVEQGEVVGFVNENGAKVWLGIPYAAAPVGDLRWRAPRQSESWAHERLALEQPSWCIQMTGALDKLYGIETGNIVGSEDCLYLNIYAPSSVGTEKPVPVMFWIHGGSNVWGRAEEYDGSVLAQKYGVVVVIVQYRLGPLGWFAHPSIRGDAKNVEDKAASFAILDQIAALKWVKNNIAGFGGDTQNITIFGESAGAANVEGLITSPLAVGLFEKAIAQSGAPRSVSIEVAQSGGSYVKNGSLQIMSELFDGRQPTPEEMRQLTPEQLYSAYAAESHAIQAPTMIADGVAIPLRNAADALVQAVKERDIPFLFGSNKDESKYFFAFNPKMTDKQFGLFPKAKDTIFYDAISDHADDAWRALGVDEVAFSLREQSVHHAYTYRFDWDEEGTHYLSDFSYLLGAAHTMEIPFVFGVFDGFLGRLSEISFKPATEESRLKLSEAMMSYWTQFAYTGSPEKGRSQTLPLWPNVASGDTILTQVLDTEQGGGIRAEHSMKTVDDVVSGIKDDPRLNRGDTRCIISRELGNIYGRGNQELANLYKQYC